MVVLLVVLLVLLLLLGHRHLVSSVAAICGTKAQAILPSTYAATSPSTVFKFRHPKRDCWFGARVRLHHQHRYRYRYWPPCWGGCPRPLPLSLCTSLTVMRMRR